MHSAVTPATIHGEGELPQRIEPLVEQVLSLRHRQNDLAKREELLLFRAQEGLTFEERDDTLQEILPPAHHEHQRGVPGAPVILPDESAAKPLAQEVEDLPAFGILADVQLGHELPTASRARVALDRNMERAFAIDEASEIRIQPFLLIVRTGQIFTAHIRTLRRG